MFCFRVDFITSVNLSQIQDTIQNVNRALESLKQFNIFKSFKLLAPGDAMQYLVTPYDLRKMGQHWFRCTRPVMVCCRQHQVITTGAYIIVDFTYQVRCDVF